MKLSKINTHFFLIIKILVIILLSTFQIKSTMLTSNLSISKIKMGQSQSLSSTQKFKFLFMLKWPSVKNEKTNPLNVLSYKNILLSTSQLVFFVSSNPASSYVDETWDTSHYIFTMQYSSMDLPCLNRSFICTHSQFIKEYRPIYPEISYNIPNEVVERFSDGDATKASTNCILIFLSPPLSVSEAAWLCHDSIEIIYQFQEKLSRTIRDENSKSYDFMADYIEAKSRRLSGIVTLTPKEIKFVDLLGKKALSISYDMIQPYAISLYLKEDLMWESVGLLKPEDARCLKIQRKGEAFLNSPDYFCIYFDRNDIKKREILNIIQARFLAEMYTNKINSRLQQNALNKSLMILNTSKKSLDVDSTVLSPIKNQIRINYFIIRHELLFYLKKGKLTVDQFETEISKSKEKIINSVCASIEICKKAIQLSLNQGLLPLKGYREKFAMDIQNPFNSLAPKSSLKITLPRGGGVGDQLIQQVHDLITEHLNTDDNSMIISIPESASGEVPNATAIKKAFNTITALRDPRKKYYRIEQLGQNCRLNTRMNTNNLKRKIAILSYVGNDDTFFEYLGKIRNEQVNPNYRVYG